MIKSPDLMICRSLYGRYYSFGPSWVSFYQFCKPAFLHFFPSSWKNLWRFISYEVKHLRSFIFRSLHRYSGAFKSALGCGTQRQTVTCSEDIPELPSLHTLVHDCAQKESQVREGGFHQRLLCFWLHLFFLRFSVTQIGWPLIWTGKSLGGSKPVCCWEHPKLYKTNKFYIFVMI